jgi:hypothetical protein
MSVAALSLLEEVGGFATTAQLLTVMTRQQLDVRVRNGSLMGIDQRGVDRFEMSVAGR